MNIYIYIFTQSLLRFNLFKSIYITIIKICSHNGHIPSLAMTVAITIAVYTGWIKQFHGNISVPLTRAKNIFNILENDVRLKYLSWIYGKAVILKNI